jgi:drug/metabolite transporter superfamily protein YnfA
MTGILTARTVLPGKWAGIWQNGRMNRMTAILILLCAALLEAGGDALVRAGLRSSSGSARAMLFGLGAVALFAYGWTVNSPPWDFGRVLGLYVVFFFVIAQGVSWYFFGQPPSRSVLIGGSLIVSGGLVIALAQS